MLRQKRLLYCYLFLLPLSAELTFGDQTTDSQNQQRLKNYNAQVISPFQHHHCPQCYTDLAYYPSLHWKTNERNRAKYMEEKTLTKCIILQSFGVGSTCDHINFFKLMEAHVTNQISFSAISPPPPPS
eukprot:TRINITY_DN18447_c0_g1_i7.p1 TRINITY_DN18447_c0_g1~~TRINITY_DN18447_c0_g1_i7.p1  ORF type:complete len:128 (-),score=10.28 TRINITY_DN18447_c0_g1_i7:135-518(-)